MTILVLFQQPASQQLCQRLNGQSKHAICPVGNYRLSEYHATIYELGSYLPDDLTELSLEWTAMLTANARRR
jgi:hypothetical protein